MFNKFLLTSFISASLLISTCGAMDEAPSLTLSTKKLQQGYELGLIEQPLELKDGTKYLVTNQYGWSNPNFECAAPKQKFTGSYDPFQKTFSFDHVMPGGPVYKWNEEKKIYEIDSETDMGEMHFFHLNVKQLMEEKAPQQFLTFGGSQIPCVWNPETKKLELDFNSFPQAIDLFNVQFNPGQQNSSPAENKPVVLQLEDKPSVLTIEENKKDEVIEQNISSNLQPIKQEVITSLSLTLENLESGYNTGTLVLKDGTKWTVKNLSLYNQPMFYMMSSPTTIVEGYYSQYEDEFCFNQWSPGMTIRKWNEEKQIEEEEFDPGMEYFNLIVKRSK